MGVRVLLLVLSLLPPLTDALPPERFPLRVDWQRGVGPQGGCGECRLEQCPVAPQCPAGRVRDTCGCCWECGNGEGQLCDPDPSAQRFYGRCGEGLRCRAPPRQDPAFARERRPARCVCTQQELLCGSDGKTYENSCQLRAARYQLQQDGKLTMDHRGPCRAKPIIATPPRDVTCVDGSDVMFGCEVSSYPMAVIEWRKEGNSIFMPADDSNMAVQARGGPRRFELTGWLQIQKVRHADEGVYTCTARNKFGEVSASARLQVVEKDSQLAHQLQLQKNGVYNISEDEDDDEDDEDYEGFSSGLTY
ncbi:kazal-type serine peptidase inhibitor domain 2 [Megalops cyprinoides]|uniref:kazal-type serine peptidase inhibitor domain 2 n=1 Tax=Megalops cyprinoides TaxID=118141 RepID=UPI001865672F|nr:kazal-type serine peptidase inhibitor domain 2 [Megalops cyprinoides]